MLFWFRHAQRLLHTHDRQHRALASQPYQALHASEPKERGCVRTVVVSASPGPNRPSGSSGSSVISVLRKPTDSKVRAQKGRSHCSSIGALHGGMPSLHSDRAMWSPGLTPEQGQSVAKHGCNVANWSCRAGQLADQGEVRGATWLLGSERVPAEAVGRPTERS